MQQHFFKWFESCGWKNLLQHWFFKWSWSCGLQKGQSNKTTILQTLPRGKPVAKRTVQYELFCKWSVYCNETSWVQQIFFFKWSVSWGWVDMLQKGWSYRTIILHMIFLSCIVSPFAQRTILKQLFSIWSAWAKRAVGRTNFQSLLKTRCISLQMVFWWNIQGQREGNIGFLAWKKTNVVRNKKLFTSSYSYIIYVKRKPPPPPPLSLSSPPPHGSSALPHRSLWRWSA